MWESFKQKKQTTPYSDVVDLIGKIESEFSINNSNDDIRERAHECIKTLYSIATKTKAPEIPEEKKQESENPETQDKGEQSTPTPPVENEAYNAIKELEKQLSTLSESVKNVEKQNMGISQSLQGQANTLHDIEQVKQSRIEEIVQNSQEDRYRKDKAKLIKRSIFQMALIRKTLYEFETQDHHETDEERIEFLLEQLNSLLTFSETTLEQEMIERLEPTQDGADVNLEQHEIIGYYETENTELDGKVYRSVNPAYVWRLPYILKAKVSEAGDVIKSYRFMLESEQVIIYKLKQII